ncbi:MAG: metallophosphoesterase [Lachnospiraceae bacterium]
MRNLSAAGEEVLFPEKTKARILVISDSHGGNGNLRYAIGQALPVDLLLHLGDVEGDLAGILGKTPPYLVRCVRGNMDTGRYPQLLLLCVCGHRIFAAHGDRYGVSTSPERISLAAREQGADVVCFGHTHVPVCETGNGILLLNPGSISRPRLGKKSYAVLTLQEGEPPAAELFTIPDRIPARWEMA